MGKTLSELIRIASTTGVVECQITEDEEKVLDALADLLEGRDLDSVKRALEE